MKNFIKSGVVALLFGAMFISCNNGKAKLGGEADTLSYVIGLNVGHALMEMDSTLNVEAVCAAIQDTYNKSPKMTLAEARDYYLAEKTYFVHAKAHAYQDRYLTDLSKRDRKYVHRSLQRFPRKQTFYERERAAESLLLLQRLY